jgi:hypothetical protein
MFLPGSVRPATLTALANRGDVSGRAILASHAFNDEARDALVSGSPDGIVEAIEIRKEALRAGVADLGRRLAEWGVPDRRSIRSLLRGSAEEQ